jgi:uncharacterized protein
MGLRMRKMSQDDLERLDRCLCGQESDEIMLLSELDGYLAGVVVCPELILPSEWLPAIWGRDEPPFEDESEAREVLGLIMALYNDIANRLMQGGAYGPLIDEDVDGTFVWEFWAEGFGKALTLRPWAWSSFGERSDDDQAARAFHMLAALAMIAKDSARAKDEDDDELDAALLHAAPDLIAASVADLHEDRIANRPRSATGSKPGRNDPCPCGSGKKYKKCCLQAGKA